MLIQDVQILMLFRFSLKNRKSNFILKIKNIFCFIKIIYIRKNYAFFIQICHFDSYSNFISCTLHITSKIKSKPYFL